MARSASPRAIGTTLLANHDAHPRSAQVFVSGELTATYDAGETRLVAAGKDLEWTVGDAPSAVSSLPAINRSDLARSSRLLAKRDLSLTVRDGSGTLLELGKGRRSPIGWALLGSVHARPRRLQRWPRIIAARLRRPRRS